MNQVPQSSCDDVIKELSRVTGVILARLDEMIKAVDYDPEWCIACGKRRVLEAGQACPVCESLNELYRSTPNDDD
jgi:hypothetical protein